MQLLLSSLLGFFMSNFNYRFSKKLLYWEKYLIF